MSNENLEDLPKRARIGYILNNAQTHQGELTPDVIADMIAMMGLTEDMTTEQWEELAEDVIAHRGGDSE